MIFQDPYGSLDPRMRVERIVAEPLAALRRTTRVERRERVAEALRSVGLGPTDAAKYPHEFSGGQRQRIAIARALITRPKLVVADEPVSALDVSVQAQALNLMSDLQREAGVTFLLISHDLAVVAHLCATTAVMYRGRIVETGPTVELSGGPPTPIRASWSRRRRGSTGGQTPPPPAGRRTLRPREAAPMRGAARSRRPAAGRSARSSRPSWAKGGRPACWFPLG